MMMCPEGEGRNARSQDNDSNNKQLVDEEHQECRNRSQTNRKDIRNGAQESRSSILPHAPMTGPSWSIRMRLPPTSISFWAPPLSCSSSRSFEDTCDGSCSSGEGAVSPLSEGIFEAFNGQRRRRGTCTAIGLMMEQSSWPTASRRSSPPLDTYGMLGESSAKSIASAVCRASFVAAFWASSGDGICSAAAALERTSATQSVCRRTEPRGDDDAQEEPMIILL